MLLPLPINKAQLEQLYNYLTPYFFLVCESIAPIHPYTHTPILFVDNSSYTHYIGNIQIM